MLPNLFSGRDRLTTRLTDCRHTVEGCVGPQRFQAVQISTVPYFGLGVYKPPCSPVSCFFTQGRFLCCSTQTFFWMGVILPGMSIGCWLVSALSTEPYLAVDYIYRPDSPFLLLHSITPFLSSGIEDSSDTDRNLWISANERTDGGTGYRWRVYIPPQFPSSASALHQSFPLISTPRLWNYNATLLSIWSDGPMDYRTKLRPRIYKPRQSYPSCFCTPHSSSTPRLWNSELLGNAVRFGTSLTSAMFNEPDEAFACRI
jgi:hypothetical protein